MYLVVSALDSRLGGLSLSLCCVFGQDTIFTRPHFSQAPVVQTLDSAIHRINQYPGLDMSLIQ